jgi:hypothetical protein
MRREALTREGRIKMRDEEGGIDEGRKDKDER